MIYLIALFVVLPLTIVVLGGSAARKRDNEEHPLHPKQ